MTPFLCIIVCIVVWVTALCPFPMNAPIDGPERSRRTFVDVTAGPLPPGLTSLHELFDLELHNNYFTQLPENFSGIIRMVECAHVAGAVMP